MGKKFITERKVMDSIPMSLYCDFPVQFYENIFELKIDVIDRAKEYSIYGNIEIDNGHSFAYNIAVFFPVHF